MSEEASQNKNILVVEDQPETAFFIKALLETEGYRAQTVHSGRGALKALGLEGGVPEAVYDLIVLDVKLPDMSGLEISERIKADERLRYIPVIILSALGGKSDVLSGLDKGADDYLIKPFDNETLLAKVRVMLRVKDLYTELQPGAGQECPVQADAGDAPGPGRDDGPHRQDAAHLRHAGRRGRLRLDRAPDGARAARARG